LFDIHAAALALRIEIIIFSMAEGSRNGAILDCPTVLSTNECLERHLGYNCSSFAQKVYLLHHTAGMHRNFVESEELNHYGVLYPRDG
jgi:hypothetical protein